jgi:CRP-like cAMP-binding protein
VQFQHSLGPNAFFSSISSFGRCLFAQRCKIEVVRQHRTLIQPAELADHVHVVLSGSVSIFAASKENRAPVLLCTLSRGQHLGELSMLFHHRNVSLADVQAEIDRAVARQASMESDAAKRSKVKRRKTARESTSRASMRMSTRRDSTRMSLASTSSALIVAENETAQVDSIPPPHRPRAIGVYVVSNEVSTLAKLEQSYALQLMSSRGGWVPSTLRIFDFLRCCNLFHRLHLPRLLQLTLAARFITFGPHECLEAQGERAAVIGGGGIWTLMSGEAECCREIAIGLHAGASMHAVSFEETLQTVHANQHLKPLTLNQLRSGDYFGEQSLETAAASDSSTANAPHDMRTAFCTVLSSSKVDLLFISAHVLTMLLPKHMLKDMRSTYATRLSFRQAAVKRMLLNSFPPSAGVHELKHSHRQRSQLLRSLPMFSTTFGHAQHHAHARNSNGGLSQEELTTLMQKGSNSSSGPGTLRTNSNVAASAASPAASAYTPLISLGLAPEFAKSNPNTLSANLSKLLTPSGSLLVGTLYTPSLAAPKPAVTLSEPPQSKIPLPLPKEVARAARRGSAFQFGADNYAALLAAPTVETLVAEAPQLPNHDELSQQIDRMSEEDLLTASSDKDASLAVQGQQLNSLQQLLRGYLKLGALDLVDPAISTPSTSLETSSMPESDEWLPREKVARAMFLETRQNISQAWGARKRWEFAISSIRKQIQASKGMGKENGNSRHSRRQSTYLSYAHKRNSSVTNAAEGQSSYTGLPFHSISLSCTLFCTLICCAFSYALRDVQRLVS